MKKRIQILSLLVFCCFSSTFAQKNISEFNSKNSATTKNTSDKHWQFLNENIHNGQDFFNEKKEELGLTSRDKMLLTKVEQDKLGVTHYKYQQYYNDVKVEGGQYSIHIGSNNSVAEGIIKKNIDVNTLPDISPNDALVIAIERTKQICNEKYENEGFSLFKNKTPAVELLIINLLSNNESTTLMLVYRVDLKIEIPIERYFSYVIDAHTGEIIEEPSFYLRATGTVETLFNGVRELETKEESSSNFKLIDETRGNGIETRNRRSGANQFVNDDDNDWSETHKKRTHASAHWAAQEVWDMYVDYFAREGPDGNGMGVSLVPMYPYFGECNAQTGPNTDPLEIDMSTSYANGCNQYVALGIVGHEFTHGVLYEMVGWHGGNISSSDEAFALSEGLCDIFGEVAEFYTLGAIDWIAGTGSVIEDTLTRTFTEPVIDGKSSLSYGDDNWNNFTDGHLRGGVLRHWFFLLSEGGVFDTITVVGIGIEKASQIAYRMADRYLKIESTFADAKNGAVFSAMELYGFCSNEVYQCIKAFNAVNVSSVNGFDYNISGNCAELTTKHSFIPLWYIAINELHSRCNITPNGNFVSFIAGKGITLKPGFDSGDYFEASIDPCLAISSKSSGNSVSNFEVELIDSLGSQNNFTTELNYNKFVNNFMIYPNPLNKTTQIRFSISKNEAVSIIIKNIIGKEITKIVDNEYYRAGDYEKYFSASNIPQGIYFCTLQSGAYTETKKMVIVR